jgi:hypothetical protein
VKRRTLDLFFSVGGVALAVLLAVLGFVLHANANFAHDYVRDQLREQRITFTPKAGLSPDEQKAKCLVENAGKPLETGKQSECYANEYIARHLREVNDGKTYSQTSNEARPARAAADEAAKNGSPDAKELAAKADALDGKVQTLFRGETLRGLLLTSYGFSTFGEKASQAAIVCWLVAAVLILASIAGFVHAATRGDEKVE